MPDLADLTPRELQVWLSLAMDSGWALSVEDIIAKIAPLYKNGRKQDQSNLIRPHVANLRKKGFHIRTLWGYGYLVDPESVKQVTDEFGLLKAYAKEVAE